jgi:S-adenosylmethionine:tRNA ribosyltransferase-isomerase
MKIQDISMVDFDYALPEERIALHPLAKRSDSRLLHYEKGNIAHRHFTDIVGLFEPSDFWVVNNTKVIPARIHFQKSTGGVIEIFCLEPLDKDYTSALTAKEKCTWLCFVGGAKKWKEGSLFKSYSLNGQQGTLEVMCVHRGDNGFVIDWKWNLGQFSEVLEAIGELPIPPYLNRATEEEDYDRYQTLFAQWEGSVAAPTASLHFDEKVINALMAKGVTQGQLTLHVGAGTFKPVSADTLGNHEMHAEYFEVSLAFITQWMEKLKQGHRTIVVGTTALRTLESLYWLGNEHATPDEHGLFHLGQWSPYQEKPENSLIQNLEYLYQKATDSGLDVIAGTTQIIIGPGYTIKTIQALITNFHQPKSTLLLLVHAIVGEDWKKIYQSALDNYYRFLSYGDSSWLSA